MPRLPRTVPPQDGRTVVVTGANSGLGHVTARALAEAGAHVVLACRDRARGEEARAAIAAAAGHDRVELRPLDLGDLASVRACAEGLLSDLPRIDVLVNNAGLMVDSRRETADGFEMMVGVNHLGHHLLTTLLAERLVASAPARVVVVGSVAHRVVRRPLDAAALMGEGRFSPMVQYGRSKLANLLFARELGRRLGPRGVTVAAVHPGSVRTGFGADGDHGLIEPLVQAFGRLVLIGPERGARTQIALAAADDGAVAPFHRAYAVRGRAHRPSRLARDDAQAAWLWAESERLVAG